MKMQLNSWFFPVLVATALGIAGGDALAQDVVSKDGTLKIQASWTRATPNGARVAGGFVTITNTGSAPDRLVGGSVAIAGHVELHEMAMENGVMKMRALDKGLEIKPGQTVQLKPGGYHLMFMELKVPVKESDMVAGTLVFERAGTVAIQYRASAMGGSYKAHGN